MDVRIEPVPLPPRRDGPTASSVFAAIVVALVVAILKPWGTVGEPVLPIEVIRSAPSGASSVSSRPTPRPTPDVARELVAALCLEPNGWRLYATERWSDRLVRSWKSIEPLAAADGPADPGIPQFPEASRAVLTLGYCAPVTGAERPPGPTTTTIYRLTNEDGSQGGDPRWEIIDPARVQPADEPSQLGGAWAPPDSGETAAASSRSASGWPGGTYVFRIATEDTGAVSYTRWFGVVVEVTRSATR
jgi:hypothetical protein